MITFRDKTVFTKITFAICINFRPSKKYTKVIIHMVIEIKFMNLTLNRICC